MERRRVGPSSYTEENFEVTIGFLEFVDGFEIAIEVVANVVPGVSWVVYVFISPDIGKEDFSRVGFDISKRI